MNFNDSISSLVESGVISKEEGRKLFVALMKKSLIYEKDTDVLIAVREFIGNSNSIN